jgi:hypothetical protein
VECPDLPFPHRRLPGRAALRETGPLSADARRSGARG